MDYIELKRTLVAAFDHFLSCHDMAELEEMMQALEAGKQLVIGFPEPIHREDYKDDVLAREEKKDDALAHEEQKDDIALMAKPSKKITSRIKHKKPKLKKQPVIQSEKHICDVAVLVDMSVLSGEKRKQLCQALKNNQHNMRLKDIMIRGQHIFAMASVTVDILPPKRKIEMSGWMGTSHVLINAEKKDKIKEHKNMLFYDKKQFDPP